MGRSHCALLGSELRLSSLSTGKSVRIVAVVNRKGGSGKTTLAVNLAAALAMRGNRVLLVDLDPQAAATAWLDGAARPHATDEQMDGRWRARRRAVATGVDSLSVLPAMGRVPGLENWTSDRLSDAVAEGIRGLSRRWDFAIMDTPGALSPLVEAALRVAREAIIPVEVGVNARGGLEGTLEEIQRIRLERNEGLRLRGVVVTRADRSRLTGELVTWLDRSYPGLRFAVTMRESVRFPEAFERGAPVVAHAPNSSAAQDMLDLADEFLIRPVWDRARGIAAGRRTPRVTSRPHLPPASQTGRPIVPLVPQVQRAAAPVPVPPAPIVLSGPTSVHGSVAQDLSTSAPLRQSRSVTGVLPAAARFPQAEPNGAPAASPFSVARPLSRGPSARPPFPPIRLRSRLELDSVRQAKVRDWFGREPNLFEHLLFRALWAISASSRRMIRHVSQHGRRLDRQAIEWPAPPGLVARDTGWWQSGAGGCPHCADSRRRGANFCQRCGRKVATAD